MLATVIAFIFFTCSHHYPKSPQEYSLSFIKQLPDTVNLSSLTYNEEDKFLYATQNSPAQLIKITRDGDIINRAPLPFISDAETIEHIQGNLFAAVDEKTSELFFFTVTKDMSISLRNRIQLEKFNKKIVVLKDWRGKQIIGYCLSQKNDALQACLPISFLQICEVQSK